MEESKEEDDLKASKLFEIFNNKLSAMTMLSGMTFKETQNFLDNVYTYAKIRQTRHDRVTQRAIQNAFNIYMKEHPFLDENGVAITMNPYPWYYDAHMEEGKEIPDHFVFRFNYGESYFGRVYENEL